MIISHEHKFIFLHCRKVAGSSVTLYLSRFLGKKDIVVGAYADFIKHNVPFPLQFYKDFLSPSAVTSTAKTLLNALRRKKRWDKKLLCECHKQLYASLSDVNPGHMLASEVQRHFPREWDEYYKFCFVRNPYHRAVSDYKWRLSKVKNKEISFNEFLKRLEDQSRPDPDLIVPEPHNNWDIYTIDDKISVDFIGRYESLEGDLKTVCERIGLPYESKNLPHAKSNRADNGDYRRFYDEESKSLVANIFAKEIDFFNYVL